MNPETGELVRDQKTHGLKWCIGASAIMNNHYNPAT